MEKGKEQKMGGRDRECREGEGKEAEIRTKMREKENDREIKRMTER